MKWLVLIGPPAVGKTTLSKQLKQYFNAKYYSFDEEFPLEVLKSSFSDSKNCRKLFLEKIKAENSDWIIIDDTCHLKSIQKRYLRENEIKVKIIFLYLSARNDQISELKTRNALRNSHVKEEEIDKMVKQLNSNQLEWDNVIEYNFKEIPEIESINRDIQRIIENYRERRFERVSVKDSKSDNNFLNLLNLALNREISAAFNENSCLNGKQISISKKNFLAEVRDNFESDADIYYLVSIFRNKFLKLQ